MVHDEDHLRHDTLKLLEQAFAMPCLVDVKAKYRKTSEDQMIKENMELRKKWNTSRLRLTDWVVCIKKPNNSKLRIPKRH